MADIAAIAYELGVFAVMGLSGVGLGVLFGWRHPLLLAAFAVVVSGALRMLGTAITWSLGRFDWAQESWWIVSIGAIVVSWTVIVVRRVRPAFVGLGYFGAMVTASLFAKYVARLGEQQHRDSASMMETALLLFQSELTPAQSPPEEKRGLAYPLLLALGPDERILGGLTPLVFLSLVLAITWFAQTLAEGTPARRFIWSGLAVVGVFSLTVPIVRIAFTYLNSHILMALSVLAIVAGVLLADGERRLTRQTMALIAVGAVVGTSARVEGIIIVLLLLSLLASRPWLTGRIQRLQVFALLLLPPVTLAWWLDTIDSLVLEGFGVGSMLVVAVSAFAAGVLVLPVLDRIRRWIFAVAVALVGLVVFTFPLLQADPIAEILAQFNNVVRGYGGWGVAALALGMSLVLLGWKKRSARYRQLVMLSLTLIVTVLFSKLFDGGGFGGSFGRDGFYDSVNRMWLHPLGVVATTMVLGYSEFISDLVSRLRGPTTTETIKSGRQSASAQGDTA